jgi:hypothetical protein
MRKDFFGESPLTIFPGSWLIRESLQVTGSSHEGNSERQRKRSRRLGEFT